MLRSQKRSRRSRRNKFFRSANVYSKFDATLSELFNYMDRTRTEIKKIKEDCQKSKTVMEDKHTEYFRVKSKELGLLTKNVEELYDLRRRELYDKARKAAEEKVAHPLH